MAGRPVRTEAEVGGRERLLAAATRLFAAKGYAATSVRDIVKAAKVTAPVLYYHFGSKERLFVGLVRSGVDVLEAEMAKALAAAASPAERVRAFGRVHVAIQQRFADLRWVVEAVVTGPPNAAPRFDFRGLFAHLVEQLADLVRGAVASGEFRRCDPTAAALAILGAAEMTVRARLHGGRLPALANPQDDVLDVVLDGLRAPAAARGRGRGRRGAAVEPVAQTRRGA